MRVAIVGSGGAGLCAGRHCLLENFDFDIFEQTGNVGGTWNYTDRVGLDDNGIPIHTSMYEGLRTNLPKELMAYEGFPYPEQRTSYVPQKQVLDYMRSYGDAFHITPHIKFHQKVLNVSPQAPNLWLVKFQDVQTKQCNFLLYDAIFICNGHYTLPRLPQIPGIETHPGSVKHSHEYRSPKEYINQTVLLVGGGPSGADISVHLVPVATKVLLSVDTALVLVPTVGVHRKAPIKYVDGSVVVFEDNSKEVVDAILLCTGYLYNFPFLNCIKVIENRVDPLYKQIVSIDHPRLAFIGLPFSVCPFPMFDIQVRFVLAIWKGHYQLPSKEAMFLELQNKLQATKNPRKFHQLGGEEQEEYFNDLAETAQIPPIPSVIHKLFKRVRMNRNLEDCFRIEDEDHWTQI